MRTAILFLLSSPALAQTLAPASPGFDFGGYGIWLVIALLGVGIFIYLKHNPTTVSSLTDLLHKQADTHAAVVATVPQALAATPAPAAPVDVQAQINAAVAAALAAQRPPMMTPQIAPMGLPVAQAQVQVSGSDPMPGETLQNYTWRVALPDEKAWLPAEAGARAAYMGASAIPAQWPAVITACRAAHPGAIANQETQAAAQLENEAHQDTYVYPGAYPATSCTVADSNYLLAVRGWYEEHTKGKVTASQGGNVFIDALNGTRVDINRVIAMTGGMGVDQASLAAYLAAPGPLVAVVGNLLAAWAAAHPGA